MTWNTIQANIVGEEEGGFLLEEENGGWNTETGRKGSNDLFKYLSSTAIHHSLSLSLFLSLDVHIGAVLDIVFLFVDQSKRIDLIKKKAISRRCIG